jgi:hypothetical protein
MSNGSQTSTCSRPTTVRHLTLTEYGPPQPVDLTDEEAEGLDSLELAVRHAPEIDTWEVSATNKVGGVRVGELQITIKPKLQVPEGHLIYPKRNEDAQDSAVRGSEVTIHCHTLDLAQPPERLLARISQLARRFAGEALAPSCRRSAKRSEIDRCRPLSCENRVSAPICVSSAARRNSSARICGRTICGQPRLLRARRRPRLPLAIGGHRSLDAIP